MCVWRLFEYKRCSIKLISYGLEKQMHAFQKLAPPTLRGSGKSDACSSEAPPPKTLSYGSFILINVGLEKQTHAHSLEAPPLRRSLYFSECQVWKTKPLPLAQNRRSLFCSIFHHCFIENRNYRAVIFIILHIHREKKL